MYTRRVPYKQLEMNIKSDINNKTFALRQETFTSMLLDGGGGGEIMFSTSHRYH